MMHYEEFLEMLDILRRHIKGVQRHLSGILSVIDRISEKKNRAAAPDSESAPDAD